MSPFTYAFGLWATALPGCGWQRRASASGRRTPGGSARARRCRSRSKSRRRAGAGVGLTVLPDRLPPAVDAVPAEGVGPARPEAGRDGAGPAGSALPSARGVPAARLSGGDGLSAGDDGGAAGVSRRAAAAGLPHVHAAGAAGGAAAAGATSRAASRWRPIWATRWSLSATGNTGRATRSAALTGGRRRG